MQDWYNIWFDSPYYHTLYKHRDEEEASDFLTRLVQKLNLPIGCKILDLACGKGRHSIYLNQLGFEVTGIDLSPANIKAAQVFETKGLRFLELDMRHPVADTYFDVVMNLFTSFGYFESTDENNDVLESVYTELKPNGIFVIDFMNCNKVIENLVSQELVCIDNTKFHITRELKNGFVIKTIEVDNNPNLIFEEKVRAFSKEDFNMMLSSNGFKVLTIYGSYLFEPFNLDTSERLILIAQRR